MKNRDSFPKTEKWQVEDIYPTIDDFNKDYAFIENSLVKYASFQNHILDNPKNLLELLEFDNDLSQRLEKLLIYAHIQNDQDTTNTYFQSLYGKVGNLYELYQAQTAFIGPEILKSDYKLINKYLEEEPKLKSYARVLKEMFKVKPYILSEKEEKLLSSISACFKTPDEVYSYLTDADLRFGKIKNEEGKNEELTEKSYRKFIESPKQEVRKKAFHKLLKTYANFQNTYASLLSSEVKKNNRASLIRGYKSALEASLFVNDIPPYIYSNLIKVVRANISPLTKYWQLKKEALHLDTLHIYDTYAPILKERTKTYTINEAKELIRNSLSVLGEDYVKNIMKAFDEGWIDYCPNDGKRNGAYCTACYNAHPYVLLSFDGSLNNVSTLIHELGHAMHYYYAIKNQKFQDYNYSIFVAEVASQVNQILLSKYLISKTTDLETKKYLIDDLINDFKATIYRQTMFSEFEKTIHEKEQNREVLTCDLLNDLYYKLNKHYYGKNIVVDKDIKYEWMRIPHFYMNFYVYQYATAYAASIIIAMNILNGQKDAKENYLEFLKLGATKSPIASLKVAGVDMESASTLEEAFQYFNSLVDELANLSEVENE